jgi:hypothetical protein
MPIILELGVLSLFRNEDQTAPIAALDQRPSPPNQNAAE